MRKLFSWNKVNILSFIKFFLIPIVPFLVFLQDKIGKRGLSGFIFEVIIIYILTFMIPKKKIAYFFNSILIFLGLFNFIVLYHSNTFLNLEMITNINNLHGIKGNSLEYICSILFILFISFLPVVKLNIKPKTITYSVLVIASGFVVIFLSKSYMWSPYYGYTFVIKDGFSLSKIYFEVQQEKKAIKDGTLVKSFEKKEIENHYTKPNALPEKPNIILIFTEGLSEHIIYDERDIMPNVRKFAEESLSFSNYYNHTFATYMGIIGQLFSGYQQNNYDSNNLVSIQSILQGEGYKTSFINTEPNNKEFTQYLENLKFNVVYSNKELVDDKKNKSLSDKIAYETLYKYMEEEWIGEEPFFVTMYTFGTHATFDSPNIKYKDGKSAFMNKFYSADYWFGNFINKFKKSPMFEDTIIVYTTDHATASDNDFIESFPSHDRVAFGLDKIPLYIYHRDVENKKIDVNGRNSLSLAPTILDYLDISAKNYFLGDTLFNNNSDNIFDKKFQSYATICTTTGNSISVLQDSFFEKKLAQYFIIKDSETQINKISAPYATASIDKIKNQCILHLYNLNSCEMLNIAIWSENGQHDDLHWFSIPYSDEVYVDFSVFNDTGMYVIDIYCIRNGVSSYGAGTTLLVN